jgi:trehalose 6-phosphate synthase/phosphatase
MVIDVRRQFSSLKVVWVHGDHLMLTPQYIRLKFPEANIGFYFHSAFPASAIFRTFYYRKEILHSIL